MSFVSDAFTESSDVALTSHAGEVGASWTEHPHVNYNGAGFSVDAATDRIFATGTDASYASGVPPSADYSFEADFYLHSAISQNVAICVRMDETADTMIIARLNNGTIWEVREIIDGDADTLGSSTNQLPSTGTAKRGRLEVQGNQVRFYVDDVLEIGPVTVTIAATGRAGVRNAGVASATTGIHLDNVSANTLYNSATLFRGRNFPFFDDEEVNRFEFWPAIVTATVHTRSTSFDATGSIASSGEFFSVFTSSVGINASAAVESSATFFSMLERSAAIDASASIATSGQRDLLRSVAVNAATTVEISGVRVVERSAVISATGAVESSGIAFTVFEALASISASASIESSGIRFSIVEAAVALSVTATVTVAGVREVSRSVSCSATATIEASGESFTLFEATVVISTSASIETAAISFSVFERQASLDSTAVITVTGQRQLFRQAALSATGTITVAGQVGNEPVTHERSAAFEASGAIASAAEFFSILTASVTVSSTGVVAVAHQRELQRSVVVAVTGAITSSGEVVGAVTQRSVSFTATGTIVTNSRYQRPTPPRRTFVVQFDQRTLTVDDVRTYVVAVEERIVT